jgi:dTDP-4-amino-4,6-dideoxygalactose transaminase
MWSAVERGHTTAGGPFSGRVASLLLRRWAPANLLLTTSCTAALKMSALLVGLSPGDTIVLPSYGFVTTALAFARAGNPHAVPRHRGTHAQRGSEPSGRDDERIRPRRRPHLFRRACDIDGIRAVLERWPGAGLGNHPEQELASVRSLVLHGLGSADVHFVVTTSAPSLQMKFLFSGKLGV